MREIQRDEVAVMKVVESR